MERLKFFDEVHDFQRFVRENINLIGNLTIISEQLKVSNNETGILDMLAIDNIDKRLVIIELKNELTTDKNIWQPLRYYDLLRRGEDELRKLIINASKINFEINEINLNPKVILVVPEYNEQLLRSLSYFNDIDSMVIELNRVKNGNMISINKKIYYPRSIFHKEDLVNIQNKVSEQWNFEKYIQYGINKDKINLAKRVCNIIKQIFKNKGYDFDIFFNQTKITITKNGKVCCYLFVKNKSLDYKLAISLKIPKNVVINFNNFAYNSCIDSYEIQKNYLKLVLNSTPPFSLFEQYF